MKKDTHPQWYPEAKVRCACGNTFLVGAAVPEITVEICSACHPFYTGQEKLIDTEGRVEKFEKKAATSAKIKQTQAQKEKIKKQKEVETKQRPRNLKEMIELAEKDAKTRENQEASTS